MKTGRQHIDRSGFPRIARIEVDAAGAARSTGGFDGVGDTLAEVVNFPFSLTR